MKILFFSYKFYPDVGGIEVNSEILANHFTAFGAELKLVTTTQAETGKDKNFPFKVVRSPSFTELFKLFKWADLVYENNPCLSLAYPQILFKKKHVVALRTWVSRLNGRIAFQDKIKYKWLDQANQVIAVSEEVRRRTFERANVIGNPYRSDLFKNLNYERNKDFVFLGRVVSDKGADMCILLLQKLRDEKNFKNRESLTLTIIGEGDDLEKLKIMVEKLNLKPYVNFTGILKGEDLVRELNKHKYLLAPSRWREPFGNIALEGMASGCLPIVSNGGGLVDAVGNAGVIFERNNQEDFFENVVHLLSNPKYENELRASFEDHLHKHKPEFVAKQYFDIIKRTFKNEK